MRTVHPLCVDGLVPPVLSLRILPGCASGRKDLGMPEEHLLVIDDSPTVLKVIEATLTKAGYLVDTAVAGAELCRQLAEDRRTARVPVVLMAPKGEDLEETFSKAPNVVDYITKPFSPEALQAVVSHVVGGRTHTLPGAGAVVMAAVSDGGG